MVTIFFLLRAITAELKFGYGHPIVLSNLKKSVIKQQEKGIKIDRSNDMDSSRYGISDRIFPVLILVNIVTW